MSKVIYANSLAAQILTAKGPLSLTRSEEQKFWSLVKDRDSENHSRFQGHINKKGYGIFSVFRKGKWRRLRAHRVAYFIYHGRIDPELTIDHLCRERDCEDDLHLEEKSRGANVLATPYSLASINLAKTHCDRGHPLSGANLRLGTKRKRVCKQCSRDYSRDYMRERTNVQTIRGEYNVEELLPE